MRAWPTHKARAGDCRGKRLTEVIAHNRPDCLEKCLKALAELEEAGVRQGETGESGGGGGGG